MVIDQFTLNEVKKIDEKVSGKSAKEMSQVIKLDEKMNYNLTYCINTNVKRFIK
jgi:hypothetical protein